MPEGGETVALLKHTLVVMGVWWVCGVGAGDDDERRRSGGGGIVT